MAKETTTKQDGSTDNESAVRAMGILRCGWSHRNS